MSAEALIRELASDGIALTANGGKLRVRAPVGVITPALRQQLIDHKPELLDALRLHAVGGADPTKLAMGRLVGTAPPDAPRIVCEYRLNASPSQWLIVLGAPGEAFDHIWRDLQVKFGGRLLQVRQHAARATQGT